MAKVLVTETVLRDAHQSLAATRMTTEEMIPILNEMDKVGYYSAEVWGGATFDACLRFLNEDPWHRLRVIREQMKNTKLQMLFRGQNISSHSWLMVIFFAIMTSIIFREVRMPSPVEAYLEKMMWPDCSPPKRQPFIIIYS